MTYKDSRATGLAIVALTAGCAPSEPMPAPILTSAAVAAQSTVGTTEPQGPAASLPIPPGALRVRSASVARIGAFPDEIVGTGQQQYEPTVQTTAVDNTYVSDLPYAQVVDVLDQSLQTLGFAVPSRNSSATGTYWTIRCSNGAPAHVAVRNSKPTTIEVLTTRAQADVLP